MSSDGASADRWQEVPTENPLPDGGYLKVPVRPREVRELNAARERSRETWQQFAQVCAGEWSEFGQLPGTRLRLVGAGIARRELRTAEQQTLARLHDLVPTAISAAGRTFTWKQVTGSSWGDIAETVGNLHQDRGAGDVPVREAPDRDNREVTVRSRTPNRFERYDLNLAALRDETGMPVLYTTGRHYDHIAGACITFPDRRWLRFPVRGSRQANAIMTATDQAGNKVVRYRFTGRLRHFLPHAMEITVHPEQPLTDEFVAAMAISAGWLNSYFFHSSGGGG